MKYLAIFRAQMHLQFANKETNLQRNALQLYFTDDETEIKLM